MGRLFGIVGLTLLLIVSSAAQGNEGAEKEGAAVGPQYLALDPVLVNLEGKRHYLRANIQLLVDSAAHGEKMKEHMPAIRHSLIILFSGRNPEQISTVEEREKLRQSAKDELKKTLQAHHADTGLEDLFFTDFMVQ